MTTPLPTGTTHAAPAPARVWAQARFELGAIVRNGEQLMVTILLPLGLLILLATTQVIDLNTQGLHAIEFATPGVMTLAIMSSALTSQAIATAFDRRNGVLRFLATTPLGQSGLLMGKILGVLLIAAVQLILITVVAYFLGWRPSLTGILLALPVAILGVAAFTALAQLLAGTVRAEAVIALANILLVVLLIGGAVLAPASQLPGVLQPIALLLPSGALGEALRGAFNDGAIPPLSLVVLLAWSAALGWGARRLFQWS
ncbi:ABC transporter permease [Jonesia denitrificans]|jgi:ABC-2 type transport system permease protein|uniref:Transport permease protein n=1 Tax=Jonesia denitrificans (strain ATCC 14870 / DSM 20603 / BCRC 15368 / CIP 55.134 / JCM 11481 / NBRC 15587 / NCTC 10816 / Prevot 55134) TaxID=471856 RepID=C7R3T6_JONDD|nr:ABC transporter permease [Jonesia denitrificans]ACV08793.1 ABC-2 type transporter [Jonesia denitrificans DSM 20603]ASE09885.1 ABC transporter [Jonesia denitrificans]QXB44419.1 ABC transporter permease [Jonesia denitrificans]SQH20782.1 ABC transporter efflux protein, DrrB family [Jonesia denitrificans]